MVTRLGIVIAATALLVAGCRGSDDVTAVKVGEHLQKAGFSTGVQDSEEFGLLLEPPLMSAAESYGGVFNISISVFDTAADRASWTSVLDKSSTEAEIAASSLTTAECGPILLEVRPGYGRPSKETQRAKFAELKGVLAAEYGPC